MMDIFPKTFGIDSDEKGLVRLVLAHTFPRVLIKRERRKEIKAAVSDLEQKYVIPPITDTKMDEIASDNNIRLFRSDLALVPGSSIEERYIILCRSLEESSTFAHELGHLLFETKKESEAIYFCKELQNTAAVGDCYREVKIVRKLWLRAARKYNIDQKKICAELKRLKLDGAPDSLTELIGTEYVLNIFVPYCTSRNTNTPIDPELIKLCGIEIDK